MGGPGWYESSWELQRGLQVHEGLEPDEPLQQAVIPAKAGIHADSEVRVDPGLRRDDLSGVAVQPSPGACPVPPSAT